MCSDHVYLKKDGRIRPDLSDWWLPGPPPCLPHAGVSLGEEGEGYVVVLRARSPRVGLACELPRVSLACELPRVSLACELSRVGLACELPRVGLACELPRVGLACELDCVTGALPYKKVIIRRFVLRLLSVLSTAGL